MSAQLRIPAAALDVDAYLRRIGYQDRVATTLATLNGLVARHTTSIAFENLNPFLGLAVTLDPESLVDKMVRRRRGGYCFEQNLLFGYVLGELGFQVSGLAARLLWDMPEETITARGHMLLRVDLDDGPYIADVGFGVLTPTAALKLEVGTEQPTPHETFRLDRVDGDWRLQAKVRGDWRSIYRFDLQRQYPQDYAVTSYYLSTRPDSHFVTGLIAARPFAAGRYTLMNRQFSVHRLDGTTERRLLASADEVLEALRRDFLIDPPETPNLRRRLEALPATDRRP